MKALLTRIRDMILGPLTYELKDHEVTSIWRKRGGVWHEYAHRRSECRGCQTTNAF